MARLITPGSSHLDDGGSQRSQPFFATDLLRRYGLRAVVALVVAAVFAFAPLGVLYWFNELRFDSVSIVEPGQNVVVKPARHRADRERDDPGGIALLQVTCEIPTYAGGWKELLSDGDPARDVTDSDYVRREQVYVRRAGHASIPFRLLGPPPVSVWLPAGDYEVLIVLEAPGGEGRVDGWPGVLPWMSVSAHCTLEERQKAVCRISLPHYNRGLDEYYASFRDAHQSPAVDLLPAVLSACERLTAFPTPAGYVLDLGEPQVTHTDDHRGCTVEVAELRSVPREWTRDQIAALRNALPEEATVARKQLSQLVDRLMWREWLQGWYCYAAAGISGLVFTRWGAIALLEPWRRGETWRESLGLLVQIFLLSVGAWLLFQIMTDSSGCQGRLRFRMR
jgi:hypothetical protein